MPNQHQTRVQVQLLGETFTVKGSVSEDEIKKTGVFLNEQTELLKQRCPSLSPKNLAILTAFNLADELLRVRRDYEALAALLDNK